MINTTLRITSNTTTATNKIVVIDIDDADTAEPATGLLPIGSSEGETCNVGLTTSTSTVYFLDLPEFICVH